MIEYNKQTSCALFMTCTSCILDGNLLLLMDESISAKMLRNGVIAFPLTTISTLSCLQTNFSVISNNLIKKSIRNFKAPCVMLCLL